jgi:hypothetical protein
MHYLHPVLRASLRGRSRNLGARGLRRCPKCNEDDHDGLRQQGDDGDQAGIDHLGPWLCAPCGALARVVGW